MKKQLIILGHLTLLVTAILALYFYKERVLYVDSGLQVFDLINKQRPSILLSRYSLVITQLIPLLFVKLGLPIKYILMAYSFSFILIYYLCYLLCIYSFKNITAGLTIALIPLILRFAFGAAICEAWTGVVYSATFYALLHYYSNWASKGKKWTVLYYTLLTFFILLNYFIHPSTLFTLSFALAFSMIYFRQYKSSRYYFSFIVIGFLYTYKFIFPSSIYEESFFTGIKMANELLPKISELPLISFFKYFYFSNYWIISVVYIATFILSIKNKKILSWLFCLVFSVVYLIVASLSFYKGDAWFMMESRLIPLVFIACIPLIQLIVDFKNNIIYPIGITILLCFSFFKLTFAVLNVQTKRIKAYEYYLEETKKYPGRKFYVFLPPLNKITPFNSWGSCHETLMLSTLNGKENSKTINFLYPFQSTDGILEGYPCVYLGVNYRFLCNEEDLNKKYFNLACDKYTELKYIEVP